VVLRPQTRYAPDGPRDTEYMAGEDGAKPRESRVYIPELHETGDGT